MKNINHKSHKSDLIKVSITRWSCGPECVGLGMILNVVSISGEGQGEITA